MGIDDHVHLRISRFVSADDRQDGVAAFGQPFDAMGSHMAELAALPSPQRRISARRTLGSWPTTCVKA
jgi:hypothetical protein